MWDQQSIAIIFQDMYVYITESKDMKDFSEDKLFWAKKGLTYGDWESGPQGDGTFVFSGSIPATPVRGCIHDAYFIHDKLNENILTRVYMNELSFQFLRYLVLLEIKQM